MSKINFISQYIYYENYTFFCLSYYFQSWPVRKTAILNFFYPLYQVKLNPSLIIYGGWTFFNPAGVHL